MEFDRAYAMRRKFEMDLCFKVVNIKDGSAAYFNRKNGSVFKSIISRVIEYIKRNKNNQYSVFVNSSPFKKWTPYRITLEDK